MLNRIVFILSEAKIILLRSYTAPNCLQQMFELLLSIERCRNAFGDELIAFCIIIDINRSYIDEYKCYAPSDVNRTWHFGIHLKDEIFIDVRTAQKAPARLRKF